MDVFWNLKAQIDEKPTHIEWALLSDAMSIKSSVYIIIQMVITVVMLILVNVLFLTKMLISFQSRPSSPLPTGILDLAIKFLILALIYFF